MKQVLVEGCHFGEISLLYGCPRTCTIVNRNYSTMAILDLLQFRKLKMEYP